jgi:hypothetical protein
VVAVWVFFPVLVLLPVLLPIFISAFVPMSVPVLVPIVSVSIEVFVSVSISVPISVSVSVSNPVLLFVLVVVFVLALVSPATTLDFVGRWRFRKENHEVLTTGGGSNYDESGRKISVLPFQRSTGKKSASFDSKVMYGCVGTCRTLAKEKKRNHQDGWD